MDRVHRRGDRRAVTLLELVLVCVFVSMLSIVMFLATRGSLTSQQKAWVTQDAQEAVHLAVSRLREELQGARVESPGLDETASALSYQKVQLVDSQVVLDSSGAPVWQGPFQITSDAQGRVVTSRENRLLSRLGDGSHLEFARPSEHSLRISLESRRGSSETGRQQATASANLEIVMPNN